MSVLSTTIKKTDTMSQIQNKLNKGGDIKFQKGTYKIKKQLIIPKNTTINLNGSTLQRCASIQSVFLNKVDENTTGYNGAGNIVIRNGTIEGMGGYSYDNLVTFFHSKGIKVSGVTFRDSLCHALEFNACSDVMVSDCKFLGYNLQSVDYTYRELIQIDWAGVSGFFLESSCGLSDCYDGTMCSNINIHDCVFNKSDYRDYPYACVGTHTQQYQGKQHYKISILNNEFHCKHNKAEQPCLSIIGMNDVNISGNKFDCDKVARIYSKTESYLTNGDKVPYANGDGWCNGVVIQNNLISCKESDAFTVKNKTKKAHKVTTKDNKYKQKV